MKASILNLNIELGNTLADIEPTGSMSIIDGAFRHKELGLRFDDLDTSIKMKKDSLILEQLVGRNGKGSINAHGFAALDSATFPGALQNVNLSLKSSWEAFRLAVSFSKPLFLMIPCWF